MEKATILLFSPVEPNVIFVPDEENIILFASDSICIPVPPEIPRIDRIGPRESVIKDILFIVPELIKETSVDTVVKLIESLFSVTTTELSEEYNFLKSLFPAYTPAPVFPYFPKTFD